MANYSKSSKVKFIEWRMGNQSIYKMIGGWKEGMPLNYSSGRVTGQVLSFGPSCERGEWIQCNVL
jgi:hypothetical protein